MSKQNPTPENDVFNLDAKSTTELVGVDIKDMNERMAKIFKDGCNPLEAVKKFHDNFTRKELAVMTEQLLREKIQ